MATDSSLQPDPEPHPESPPSKRPELVPETSPISPSSKGKAPMEEPSAAAELGDASEGDAYLQASCCGICLSEEGSAVRGFIDSCDHYFCFLCIIEWSKIESRCPLCKGRFGSIRRMRTDGSFIGERSVVVPVRDQIYDHERNTTSGPIDPYSNISCNICAGSSDENLMLLCDLCDTAVHTYCSGLGATVPEDDWFCQECAQMKAEELNGEPVTNMGSSTSTNRNREKPYVQAPSSIFDIVRGPQEPGDPEVERLLTLFSPQQQRSLSSANARPRQANRNVNGVSKRGSSSGINSENKVTRSSVRTLHRCRDVNKYIRDLRENWNALRSGSLSFSSGQIDSRATNNSRVDGSSRGHGSNGSFCGDTSNRSLYDVDRAWKMFEVAKSKQPQKLSGTTPPTSRNLSLKVSSSKDSKNLSLGASSQSVPSKTKSSTFSELTMQQSFKKSSGTTPSTSRNLSLKVSSSKDSENLILGASSKSVPSKTKSSTLSGLKMHQSFKKLSFTTPLTSRNLSVEVSSSNDSKNLFLGASSKSVVSKTKSCTFSALEMHQSFKKHDECGSKRSGQQKNCIILGRENTSFSYTGLATSAFQGKCIIPSNKNTENTNKQESVQNDVFHGRAAMSSQEKLGQGSSHVYHERVFSSCTKSPVGSLTGASSMSCTNLQVKAASLNLEVCSGQNMHSDSKNTSVSSQLHKSAGKRGNSENIGCEQKRVKVDDETKSEIQSLVKLNLKLLTAGEKLEVDMFKDIARRSTHEILAACGLESRIHSRTPIIPKPNCCHYDQINHQSKSSLMPRSCRECFYAFVKDMVSSVMSAKISGVKS